MRQVGGVVAMLSCCMGLAACAGQTDQAGQVTATSARLNAHGRTDASPGHYVFQYAPVAAWLGTAGQYATPVRGPFPPHIPADGSQVAFGEAVAGLRPGTTYSYRVCGGDAQVIPDACAATRTFTTAAGARVPDPIRSTPFSQFNGFANGVAAGDFDRDGALDLAITAGTGVGPGPPGPMMVFTGDGSGGFRPAASVPVPGLTAPVGVVARDTDHDGRTDLVVGGRDAVALLRGDGAGGFAPGPSTATGGAVGRLVAADLDRDGSTDLIAGVSSTTDPGHVAVLRGTGTGAFTAWPSVAARGPFAVGDMNQDGKADLVSATTGPVGVAVRFGDGNGRFGAAQTTPVPGVARIDGLALGDVDRNGSRDAVVVGGTGPGAFLPGDAHGRLGPAVAVPNVPNQALVLADFDADGRLDLAGGWSPGSSSTLPYRIRVVPGNGDGTFRTPTDVQYDPLASEDIYVQVDLAQGLATDLFRDGRPSLVTVGRAGTGSGPFGQLKVFRPGRTAP